MSPLQPPVQEQGSPWSRAALQEEGRPGEEGAGSRPGGLPLPTLRASPRGPAADGSPGDMHVKAGLLFVTG